jgi:hypothetical protein
VGLLVERVQAAPHGRVVRLVRVGVEAAGHYHQPLVGAGVLPADWQLVQANPAHVAAQRRVTGRRRLETDALDLVAVSDLLRAGHGAGHRVLTPALAELAAWVAHRERRVATRTATKDQLLGRVDRAFPGPGRLPLGPVRHQGRPTGAGRVHRPGAAQRAWVAGFQQAAAGRDVQVFGLPRRRPAAVLAPAATRRPPGTGPALPYGTTGARPSTCSHRLVISRG